MFTIAGFSTTEPAALAETQIVPIPDQHMHIEGNFLYMGSLDQIIGLYCGGATTITRAHIASPSLRRLANYEICPIEAALEPAGADCVSLHPLNPLSLETNEGVEALVTAGQAVPTGEVIVGMMLADGAISPTTGEIFHVHATATLPAAAVKVWHNAGITFGDTLPVGRYALVGAQVYAADGVLFRFVPIGESFRPGGVCTGAVGVQCHELQRNGGLGVWCEFDQITPPSIEVVNSVTGAATAVTMILDLIKIG